jgi:formylmethanofuran dehydrogenase subunit D
MIAVAGKNGDKVKVPSDHGEVIGVQDDNISSTPSPVDFPHSKVNPAKEDEKVIKIVE